MRSTRPIPGNPWPHDMTIRIDDNPNNINELLFIRSAWRIALDVDIPPLNPLPEPGESFLPETAGAAEWSARWSRAWTRAWGWYLIQDVSARPTTDLLRELSMPAQPLHPAFPPFWNVEYTDGGVDRDAFNAWERSLRGEPQLSYERQPERVCLSALIAAWKVGLETVVTVPYAGYFARRISPRHLAVSNETRADAAKYDRALTTWAAGKG